MVGISGGGSGEAGERSGFSQLEVCSSQLVMPLSFVCGGKQPDPGEASRGSITDPYSQERPRLLTFKEI